MKRKSIVLVVIVFVLILGAASIWKVSANKSEIAETSKRVKNIGKKVDALYSDDKKEMLATDISQQAFEEVNALLKKEEGQEMSEEVASKLGGTINELSTAEQMFKLQEQANALLDENGVIVENADVTVVEELATDLEKDKPDFVAVQKVKIENAKAQQIAITDAANSVNVLFTSLNWTESESRC